MGWKILNLAADDFITIDDSIIPEMMRLLARNNPKIEAGESSVAGLAALSDAMKDQGVAGELGLDNESVVLLFGTEGATDADIYHAIVG